MFFFFFFFLMRALFLFRQNNLSVRGSNCFPLCMFWCVYLLGDLVQVCAFPVHTPLSWFPKSLFCALIRSVCPRAAALLKEQGSLTRVGGWCLAVLHKASCILIWGG